MNMDKLFVLLLFELDDGPMACQVEAEIGRNVSQEDAKARLERTDDQIRSPLYYRLQ